MTQDEINPLKNGESKEIFENSASAEEQPKLLTSNTENVQELDVNNDNITKDCDDNSLEEDKDDNISIVSADTTATSRSKSPNSRLLHRITKPPKIVKPLFKYK